MHRDECQVFAKHISADTDIDAAQQRYRNMLLDNIGMMNGLGGTKRPVDPGAPAPPQAKQAVKLPVVAAARRATMVFTTSSSATAQVLQATAVMSSSSDPRPRFRVMKIITPPPGLLLNVKPLTTNAPIPLVTQHVPQAPTAVAKAAVSSSSSSVRTLSTSLSSAPSDISVRGGLNIDVALLHADLEAMIGLKNTARDDAQDKWPTTASEVQPRITGAERVIREHYAQAVAYYEFMRALCNSRIELLAVNVIEPPPVGMNNTKFLKSLINKPLDVLIGLKKPKIPMWTENLSRVRSAAGDRLPLHDREFIEVLVKFLLEQAKKFYWMLYLFHVYAKLSREEKDTPKDTLSTRMIKLYDINRLYVIKMSSITDCGRDIMSKISN